MSFRIKETLKDLRWQLTHWSAMRKFATAKSAEWYKGRILKNSHSIEIYKPPLYTGKKHYMQQYKIMGLHTYIGGCSNLEIVEKIKEDIEDIQKDKFFKNIYFDLSIFNTLFKHIDFNALFDKQRWT